MQSRTAERQSNHRPRDLLTVVAIALIASVATGFIHEGIGHGGACILVGGKPRLITSMNFSGDQHGLPQWASRLIAAGGTIANLVAALISSWLLLRAKSDYTRYFWWLFTASNLLVATGYFLYSGVGNIGDWAKVTSGLAYPILWRVILALGGAITYFLAMLLLARLLAPMLGGDAAERFRAATGLLLPPYIASGLLSLAAGILNPDAKALILISAVAASFGGMCGLVWIPQFLRDESYASVAAQPLSIARHWGWITAGALTAATFIAILGPGIRFGGA